MDGLKPEQIYIRSNDGNLLMYRGEDEVKNLCYKKRKRGQKIEVIHVDSEKLGKCEAWPWGPGLPRWIAAILAGCDYNEVVPGQKGKGLAGVGLGKLADRKTYFKLTQLSLDECESAVVIEGLINSELDRIEKILREESSCSVYQNASISTFGLRYSFSCPPNLRWET